MDRTNRTFTISKLIQSFIKNSPYRKKLEEASAINAWPEVVGDLIKNKAKATAIKDGLLYVKVDHAVWRQELYMQKLTIIQKLNNALGKKIVKDIRFQ